MSSRMIIASQSVIWIIVALFLFLAPETIVTFFGATHTQFTLTLARIFGAELTGLALVSWFTRNPQDPKVLQALLLSYFTCNTLGFIASLLGRMSGTMIPRGWLVVALYLVYALLFAYLLLTKPKRVGA